MHSEKLQNIGIFIEKPKSPQSSLDSQYTVAFMDYFKIPKYVLWNLPVISFPWSFAEKISVVVLDKRQTMKHGHVDK
jgi:hypothetical protein